MTKSVLPFKAVLYNPEAVGDLSKVMAPPYDVIKPAYQDELHARHPHNIIRLILGKDEEGDSDTSNKYSRAAADLNKWLEEGVLKRDEAPAIYYYKQSFEINGENHERDGFLARKHIDEGADGKGSVLRHEKTLSGPKADRLKLMGACNSNLSAIFALYHEPDVEPSARIARRIKEAATGEPIIDVIDGDGVTNKVWRLGDPALLDDVTTAMEGKRFFIADGHHRYETALNYKNQVRAEKGLGDGGPDLPSDFLMVYFCSMDEGGLSIFPTHRVVHSLDDFNADSFLTRCAKYFFVDEFFFDGQDEDVARERFLAKLNASEVVEEGKNPDISFGLSIKGRESFFILTLKGDEYLDIFFDADAPEVYKRLDVNVLHTMILGDILELDQKSQEKQTNLKYVKSMDDAIAAAHDDANQLVFFMNATRIEQVREIAEAGLVMPQKSTYFYPKLLTGLTINLLSD